MLQGCEWAEWLHIWRQPPESGVFNGASRPRSWQLKRRCWCWFFWTARLRPPDWFSTPHSGAEWHGGSNHWTPGQHYSPNYTADKGEVGIQTCGLYCRMCLVFYRAGALKSCGLGGLLSPFGFGHVINLNNGFSNVEAGVQWRQHLGLSLCDIVCSVYLGLPLLLDWLSLQKDIYTWL